MCKCRWEVGGAAVGKGVGELVSDCREEAWGLLCTCKGEGAEDWHASVGMKEWVVSI